MNKTTKSKPAARAAAPRNYVPRDVPANQVPVAAAEQSPKVVEELDYLSNSLGVLEQSLEALSHKLTPVLTPVLDGKALEGEIPKEMSPLAQTIDVLKRRVWATNARVNELINRLEV